MSSDEITMKNIRPVLDRLAKLSLDDKFTTENFAAELDKAKDQLNERDYLIMVSVLRNAADHTIEQCIERSETLEMFEELSKIMPGISDEDMEEDSQKARATLKERISAYTQIKQIAEDILTSIKERNDVFFNGYSYN